MVVCLGLCCAIVVIIIVRQKKNRKLASPAYSGIRLMDADQMAIDMKNLHMTVAQSTNGTVGTGKLTQMNGNLYVLDAETSYSPPKVAPPATPLEFVFPPPPSSDFAESSDYAEPVVNSRSTSCSATLPLLNVSEDSGFSSKSQKSISPNSPGHLCKVPRSKSNLSGSRKYSTDDDDGNHLHYASSDVTCRLSNNWK